MSFETTLESEKGMPGERPTSLFDRESERTGAAVFVQTFLRGLGVGFVATQVLDVVSHYLYESLSDEDFEQEEQARGYQQAYEVAVQKIARFYGKELNESEMKFWGWKFHRSFGLSGGLQYMALRKMVPQVGYGYGIPFGLAFWVLADEIGIYGAGLVPGPQKFNWKAHARGAIAHIAYGVAAELTARAYDAISVYEGQGNLPGTKASYSLGQGAG
jgi:Protein of unknown function (DUF1440)